MRKLKNSVPHVGHRRSRGLGDGGRIGGARVVDVALEQQRITEIGRVRPQIRRRLRVVAIGLVLFQRVIGDQPVADALGVVRHQVVDARYLLVERAGGDDAEHPRNPDAVIDLLLRADRECRSD